MSIQKMKKLRLVAIRSKKEELLRELIRLGCVEFSEQDTAGNEQAVRESSQLMSLKSQRTALVGAVNTLGKYAPVKSSLLAPTPEFDGEVLLDDSDIEAAMQVTATIEGSEDRIRRANAEDSRQRGIIESLAPWMKLDLPLEQDGTERTIILKGTFPVRQSLDAVANALRQVSEEAELFPVSDDKTAHYALIVCMKEDAAAMQETLRTFGFAAAAVTGMIGTAKECTAAAEAAIKALAAEKEEATKAIVAQAGQRDALKLAADKLQAKIAMAEAEETMLGTEKTVVMEGWMPADKEEELGKLFDAYDCAWEAEEPAEEEYPNVPVKLVNNKFTNALNMVTNMYSLPAYGTVDPNPLMAPFFILFFGLMMADIGYGIIMIIAAVVALKKMKPREGNLAFAQLLLYGGISTTLCGVLTGGLFSDIPKQVYDIVNPNGNWQGLWNLFSPETDSTLVLYGSMVLGVLHLNTGLAVNFSQKLKRGEVASAVFEELSLWIMLVGGLVWGSTMLFSGVSPVVGKVGLGILAVGTAMLLFGSGREEKGFGKITAAFGCIYNTATGWFGDILSYSRIMALMLAGGVVGKVFNTVAVMPAKNAGGFNVVTFIVFVLIFTIGHVLNFALNLLGCYVHDLRLQCLEFFGKFYQDGGKAFKPLKFEGDYVRAKEN